MRIGFTIIYNGLQHLKHNDFAGFMQRNFDYWIVVEGLAGNGGSTGWCNNVDLPPRSTDGTHEFMLEMAQYPNVDYFSLGSRWGSKDKMCKKVISMIPRHVHRCFLWQVDADEQWTTEQLELSETELTKARSNIGVARFRQHVGDYIAVGDWGSGYHKRLWVWKKGQVFRRHEPPTLSGELNRACLLSSVYEHYSYTFEDDVRFKSEYYGGHENVYSNWLKLLERTDDNIPISELFGVETQIGKSNSKLCRNVRG